MMATIGDPDFTQDGFQRLIADLETLGGIAYTRRQAETYLLEAKESLAIFPDGPTKETLIDIADYALARKG
jgi:geranylgeranyl pyrophosphate synthase